MPKGSLKKIARKIKVSDDIRVVIQAWRDKDGELHIRLGGDVRQVKQLIADTEATLDW